jgi:hypothetical protein
MGEAGRHGIHEAINLALKIAIAFRKRQRDE